MNESYCLWKVKFNHIDKIGISIKMCHDKYAAKWSPNKQIKANNDLEAQSNTCK
jgi:hypothetical protein